MSYITEVPKFIEIEKSDDRSMHAFVNELNELNIYDQLQSALDTNPKKTTIHLLNYYAVPKTNTYQREYSDSIIRSIRRQSG